MNSRSLLIGVIILALVGGALYLGFNSLNTQQNPLDNTQPVGGGPGDVTNLTDVKEFKVKGMLIQDAATGQRLPRFDTEEIRVKQGDRVRIVFENTEGFHDFVVDEFNARTKQIPVGQTDTIEFVADKTGSFEYYCSVPGHRQNGMLGQLIVE